MDQLGLFSAVEEDDFSNVQYWTERDFINTLESSGADKFKEAIKAFGFSESMANHLLRSHYEKRIQLMFKHIWRDVPAFISGADEEDIQENLQNPLVLNAEKNRKLMSSNSMIDQLYKEQLREWVGDERWGFNSFGHFDSLETWLRILARYAQFQNEVITLNAEQITPDQLRKGDELCVITRRGDIGIGVVTSGEYNKRRDGVYGRINVWVRQWLTDHPQHVSAFGGTERYLEWMAHHPLLKELSTRSISTFSGAEFYRVGHEDGFESLLVDNDTVVQALQTLPLPESPEAYWQFMSWSKSDWVHEFHREAMHDALAYHMARFELSHGIRLVQNHNPKPSRRGSYYDKLPPDELIQPLVDALIDANSFEGVQEVLKSYYWIHYETYAEKDEDYRVCMIDTDCSCYDALYKSTMAQTTDSKLITTILQIYAINTGFASDGTVSWDVENGIVVQPLNGDENEYYIRRYNRVLSKLPTAQFLGVFDQRENEAPMDEADMPDEDVNENNEGCCFVGDFDEDDVVDEEAELYV